MAVRIITSIKDLSREDWLSLRKNGLGGSDAGAVCGVNPYKSPMAVFQDKTSDTIEETDSEAIRIGHDLEQYVAERFSEATGMKVRRSNMMYQSVEHPFMLADIDRIIVGEDAGLECKTASAYNADKWKEGNIPLHYVMQCYHYMAVTGRRTWYIACVILGREFVYRKLSWDDNIINGLVRMEEKFWNEHVVSRILPEPDGSKISDEVLQQYFKKARKESAIQLVGFDEKLERRSAILKDIERLTKEQNQIDQEIKLFMKDNELALNENYRVSWSNVETTRLDTKKIKEEKPEVYNAYAKTTSTRRFQVKVA